MQTELAPRGGTILQTKQRPPHGAKGFRNQKWRRPEWGQALPPGKSTSTGGDDLGLRARPPPTGGNVLCLLARAPPTGGNLLCLVARAPPTGGNVACLVARPPPTGDGHSGRREAADQLKHRAGTADQQRPARNGLTGPPGRHMAGCASSSEVRHLRSSSPGRPLERCFGWGRPPKESWQLAGRCA